MKISLAAALMIVFLAGFAASCTPARYILATADNTMARNPLQPALLGPDNGDMRIETLDQWTDHREVLLQTFSDEMYGPVPPAPASLAITNQVVLDENAYDSSARLESWTLSITPVGATPIEMQLGVVWPKNVSPRAIMLIPSDCGLRATLAHDAFSPPTAYRPGWCGSADSLGGPPSGFIGSLFGEHIVTPPLSELAERGYVTLAWHESTIAPDSNEHLTAALMALGLDPQASDRTGVLTLWAWTISAVITASETRPDLADLPKIAFGHSRRGKAVILASARDARLDLVLSHQSGTAGAAPHNDPVGEPVSDVVESYPHWFTPHFARYAGSEDQIPVNQHQLIALIAPRSVHLGGSKRDTWADPAGASFAARTAAPAWQFYGVDPDTRISTHLRNGTHGIHASDWRAFFEAGERVINTDQP